MPLPHFTDEENKGTERPCTLPKIIEPVNGESSL